VTLERPASPETQIRFRLEQLVEDVKGRSGKTDALVPQETLNVVQKLVELAKETAADDPVLQAVELPAQPKYAELYPLLRQVVLALPVSIGIA
jgi:hypothetical protein